MRSRFLLPAIVALLACGDDPPAPALTPFTIWVLEERLGLETDERALANATVIVDANGRTTKTTNANGQVTFDVDLAPGGATVTAFTADHTVVTMLEASPETARARPDLHGKPPGDLVVLLPRLDRLVRDRSVALSGALTKKTDATTVIDLSASGLPRIGSLRTEEDRYEIRVPRDRAFFLLGHEMRIAEGDVVVSNQHLRAFRIEAAARGSDATLDIDVSTAPPVPTRVVRLRAELPKGSVFDGDTTKATAFVRSLDSQIAVGPLVSSKNAGGAREMELAVVDTDVAGERLVTRVLVAAKNGATSVVTAPGIASDGTAFSQFALPPSVPEDTNRTLADPIALEDFPPNATLRIQAFANDQLFWIIHGPPSGLRSKTVTLPSPSGVQFNTDVQLVALSIEARFDRKLLGSTEIYERVAIAPDLVVRRK